MLCSLPAPTYSKEKEKESNTHMTMRNAATTVTIFIINCLTENSNDFAASRREGNCGCASSSTNSSPPLSMPRNAKAAASDKSTPAAYSATTATNGSAKNAEETAIYTGILALHEMNPSANTTRLCRDLLSNPRVVSTAAAVQPKPISTEKAARPVSPTRRNNPSVIKASAERKPLSSIKNSAKYKMAICGTKDRSMPTLENKFSTNAAATGAPAPAMSEAREPPQTSETSVSHKSLSRTPGIFLANARKNTASMAKANRGSAMYLLYKIAAALPSRRAPADQAPASSCSTGS